MEDSELKKLWQSYDQKLEEAKLLNMQSWALNLQSFEMLQSHKAKSKLTSLKTLRIVEVCLLIATLIYLGSFLFMHFAEPWFAISAAALMIFFTVALSNCIRQLVIIAQVKYSNNILDIQQKLTLLQSHLNNYIRLVFLCLPAYLAFPIIGFKALYGIDIVRVFDHSWLVSQIVFSILLVPVCIWLFKQVSYKNIYKKWVRNIIEKSAGNSVSEAMQFIREIEDFKKNI